RLSAQLGNRACTHRLSEFGAILLADLKRLGSKRGNRREGASAFPDCARKQALGQGRGDQEADIERARRFTEYRDQSGISAKCRDVLPHPAERGDLIKQTVVAGRVRSGLLRQLRMRKKAEYVETVVDGHHHNSVSSQMIAVIFGLGASAVKIAAPMYPDH